MQPAARCRLRALSRAIRARRRVARVVSAYQREWALTDVSERSLRPRPGPKLLQGNAFTERELGDFLESEIDPKIIFQKA
jgi:hypothetical protein